MSKNPKKQNNLFRDKLNQIEQASREMEKERKKIVVECAHQNEKGKLKIYPIGENGMYQCKYCKAKFNMMPIPTSTLGDALETVHNAIQQIRCLSDVNEDYKMIKLLGSLDFNLQETQELYTRIVSVYGNGHTKNKNKKNKNREDGFGGYGSGQLSFIGGNRK